MKTHTNFYLINTITGEDYRYRSLEQAMKGAKLFTMLAMRIGEEAPKIVSAEEYAIINLGASDE